ncbi:TOBE domain-containing protein [Ramlibacter sp. XY19]|uniref:TOBE domain-containing protein n=1 Tax=Ramlibacter paludis TaxID=2908000 RepID=UPI0023DB7654|nr:TOBE domain-containing protein [Ramlibacter paludis]MCG2593094.1 TOBE domain-containing protein [Ramlibacter paludis]
MPKKPPLEIAGALGHQSADKRLEILRRVAAVGSISQSARDAGVSYKAAWQALDTLSNLAGAALVERAVGGAGGGGARLTAAGEQVLQAADELGKARDAVLERLAKPGPSLAGIGLRTSMRNHLPARVAVVRPRAGAIDVVLVLAGGAALTSRITRESAQLLGLQRGLDVLALCKATAVTVAASGEAGANLLEGTVTRAPRATGGEVAMQLDGGLQLVGFADAASGLRVGSHAVARVEAAALVIALRE